MKVLRLQLARQTQSVGWLELFFDLVYVATISALGNWLSHHISLEGIGGFVLVFTPVWSSWVGTVIFFNRFDQSDIGQRLLVFLQMFFVLGLAVHLRDPLGELSTGFALSYVMVLVVRILMFGRAWASFPEERPLIRRFILGDVPQVLIWLVSAFVPSPLRFVLWGASVLWGICVPLLPQMRRWGERMRPDAHHLSERVGLFTIIVLGEAFIKVVTSSLGEGHRPFGMDAAFSFLVVASLWWVYFDHANSATLRKEQRAQFAWFFAHLPLAIGITGVGVAIKRMVPVEPGHAPDSWDRWLLLGSLILCWLVLAFLERRTQAAVHANRRLLVVGRLLGAAVLLGIMLQGGALDAVWILSLAAVTCVVQVALDVQWHSRVARVRDKGTPSS